MKPASIYAYAAVAACGAVAAAAANANATTAPVGEESEFIAMQKFMVQPVSSWTTQQMLLFPWLFIIPAEILGLISSTMIYFLGSVETDLPYGKATGVPLDSKSIRYVWFNRLVLLPFISFLIVRTVWNSDAIVYDMDKLNIWNGLFAFICCFSLSDLSYYTGHRIVHKHKWLYRYVHKHHHGEAEPIRGWTDTCNAHPTDFFYTGFTTSPMSSLWLFPAGSIHIVAIAACLWINSFVGSLGHCRLDLNWIVFNTRFHAGHHAYSTVNFAQNIELWDRLFGTYKDLDVDGKKKYIASKSNSAAATKKVA